MAAAISPGSVLPLLPGQEELEHSRRPPAQRAQLGPVPQGRAEAGQETEFSLKKKKNQDFEEKKVRSASETSCVPWKLTRGTASTADATRVHSPSRAVSIALLGCRGRPPSQLLRRCSSKRRARRQAVREAGRVPLAIFIKLDAFWQNISLGVSQQPWKAAVGCSGARARRVGERRRDTHLTRRTALGGSLAASCLPRAPARCPRLCSSSLSPAPSQGAARQSSSRLVSD